MSHKYLETDGDTLKAALVRLQILETSVLLPSPYQVATGIAGKSRLYFVFIPHGQSGGGINLVAKFDEPERASHEWDHIEEFQRLNVCPEVMLPIAGNIRSDSVILYRAAEGATLTGRLFQLSSLLEKQLLTNPTNSQKALDFAYQALSHFYNHEPGAARLTSNLTVLTWEHVFPGLQQSSNAPAETDSLLAELQGIAERHILTIDWSAHWLIFPGIAIHQRLPNPLHDLRERLTKTTGRVKLSRVHGDLNLTNILVTQTDSFAPHGIFIIDLANCESEKLTAIDFARLESEFWHEVYPKLLPHTDSLSILNTFFTLRANLEGRLKGIGELPPELTRSVLPFISYHRNWATRILNPNTSNYLLYDYFHCLYFTDLHSLRFKSMRDDPIKVQLALLGASLSLQTINDIEAGRYVEGALEQLSLTTHVDQMSRGISESQVHTPHKDMAPHLIETRQPHERTREERSIILGALLPAALEVESLRDARKRAMVIGNLPNPIPINIAYHDTDIFHIQSLINTCLEYPGGIAKLLEVLNTYEKGKPAFERFHAIAHHLMPTEVPAQNS